MAKSDNTVLDYQGPYQSPVAVAAVSPGTEEFAVKKTPVVAVGEMQGPKSPEGGEVMVEKAPAVAMGETTGPKPPVTVGDMTGQKSP